MKTFEEKLAYNQSKCDPKKPNFSDGYCLGVRWYAEYPKMSREKRNVQLECIDLTKQSAKLGDVFSKGIMCGIRDASIERKARKQH